MRTRRPRLPAFPVALALLCGGCQAGPVNLPFPTLGGKQLWGDERVDCGWRIQRHAWTGHHRLLDPSDVRWAWGSYAECEARLDLELDDADLEPRSRHAVVLLHGMIRAKESLDDVAERLDDEGFEVVSVNYPSACGSVAEHAAQLQRVLGRLRGIERVSFVTHSLGGLVLRQALANPGALPASVEAPEVQRAVMLFPPSQGAYLADYWGDTWPYRVFGGPAGQELRPERAASIPAPSFPFAIVAGGRGDGEGRNPRIPGDDDGTVAVSEARLPGAERFEVLDVGHTFGMSDPQVLDVVADYLAR